MSDTASESQDVLQLGRKLVDELEAEAQRDVLARWMAQHVAECITKAEETGDPSDVSAAFNAVLRLWDHRHSLPKRSRPLRDFDAIFDTLVALDPSNHLARYYRATRETAEGTEMDEDFRKWLELAEGIDVTARASIKRCLESAAASADDGLSTWIDAARAAGLEPEADLRTVEVLIGYESAPAEPDGDDVERMKDLVEKLKSFKQVSAEVIRDLQSQLDSIGSSGS